MEGRVDLKAVRSLIDEIEAIRARLRFLKVEMREKMRAELTPGQLRKLRESRMR